MGKISDCRQSKKCRMTIIGILMFLVLLLLIFMKKWKIAFLTIFILLAIAMWLEGYNYDIDLQKFWETWNYKESRVETIKDKNGKNIRIITWKCARNDFDLNCKDFSTWREAQDKYNECAEEIKKNNPQITNIKDLDIYGLDKNYNWIVCEHLPWAPKLAK
jgi:hypothetical protein